MLKRKADKAKARPLAEADQNLVMHVGLPILGEHVLMTRSIAVAGKPVAGGTSKPHGKSR
jgi:hypothetical protein